MAQIKKEFNLHSYKSLSSNSLSRFYKYGVVTLLLQEIAFFISFLLSGNFNTHKIAKIVLLSSASPSLEFSLKKTCFIEILIKFSQEPINHSLVKFFCHVRKAWDNFH